MPYTGVLIVKRRDFDEDSKIINWGIFNKKKDCIQALFPYLIEHNILNPILQEGESLSEWVSETLESATSAINLKRILKQHSTYEHTVWDCRIWKADIM